MSSTIRRCVPSFRSNLRIALSSPSKMQAFIPTAALSASTQPSTRATCTRRSLLRGAAALLAARPIQRLLAEDANALSAMDARGKSAGTAPLAEFARLLEGGDVRYVWFYGSFLDTCVFLDKSGAYRTIGEGYPVERARSTESPKQIIAKVREWGVPYYIDSPVDRRFLRKNES